MRLVLQLGHMLAMDNFQHLSRKTYVVPDAMVPSWCSSVASKSHKTCKSWTHYTWFLLQIVLNACQQELMACGAGSKLNLLPCLFGQWQLLTIGLVGAAFQKQPQARPRNAASVYATSEYMEAKKVDATHSHSQSDVNKVRLQVTFHILATQACHMSIILALAPAT